MNTKIGDKIKNFSPVQFLVLGYFSIIFIGALLLMLPFAARVPGSTNFLDAFFTSTSAVCVTGLVRVDTYTHWSLFGQLVILLLIQIGGIGFMTIAFSFISLTRRRIGLAPRVVLQNSLSSPHLGGIVKITHFIILGTVIVEGIGAFLLSFYFCPKLGLLKGIWYSIFHSISAFCNAGFDLMGVYAPFSSFTGASGNWYVNIILMLLIIIGGLGFFVWKDSLENKFEFSKLKLQSKLVYFVSFVLILGGFFFIYILESASPSFRELPLSERLISTLFQSVTTRTAGFNTMDLTGMTEGSQFLMICLMMVGGSTGSTAGGMKTTTLALLLLSISVVFKKRKTIEAYGRRIDESLIYLVTCVFMLYLMISCSAGILISSIEQVPLMTGIFESVSAIATVGLSFGITPHLGVLSQVILILLMFFGRAGSLTILFALASDKHTVASKLPLEKVQIG